MEDKINLLLLENAFAIEPITSNNTGILNSCQLLNNYKIITKLICEDDQNGNLYLQAEIQDLLDSNIDLSTLIQLRNNGWEYNKEKRVILKYL